MTARPTNKFSFLELAGEDGDINTAALSKSVAAESRKGAVDRQSRNDSKTSKTSQAPVARKEASRGKDNLKSRLVFDNAPSGPSRDVPVDPAADRENRRPRGERSERRGRGRAPHPHRGREFDRHSGTGRTDTTKRETTGPHSWGDPVDSAVKSAGLEPQENVDEVADANGNAEFPEWGANEQQEAVEPEAVEITLDEYLSSKSSSRVGPKLEHRKANDGQDAFKDAKAYTRDTTELFPSRVDTTSKSVHQKGKDTHGSQKRPVKKAQKMQLDFTTIPSGGRSGGRFEGGRGRARGSPRGGRGGGGDRQQRPPRREERPQQSSWGSRQPDTSQVNINDADAFPKLG